MVDVTYPCYWEKKDNRGEWYWVYYAANGKAIGRSSEGYARRVDCERSIAIMQESGASPIFYDE